MGTSFPEGFDTFLEPSIPEDTPLSSAGSGNKNHPESHRDLGDALEAMQRNVSLRIHDHSGDASESGGRSHGLKLKQVNTHEECDVDVSPTSIHHTIDPTRTSPNKAAAANHTHDYNDGSILNVPFVRCLSTERPASPTEGMMIWEMDTRRMRVYSSFPNNSIVTGLFSIDYFNRVSALNMGADWEQWYSDGAAPNGRMATPDGLHCSWIDQGNDSNTCIARRINPADRVTSSDDQVITWKTGDVRIEEEVILTEGATNDKYFRMSEDRQHYVRLRIGEDYIKAFFTKTGPAGEKHLGTLDDIDTENTQMEWRSEFVDRTLRIYKNGEPQGTIIDTKAQTSKGPNFRGWGIGMTSGDRFLGQTTPANLDWVSIQDYVRYTSIERWSLLPVSNKPVTRLRQQKAQKLSSLGTFLEWTEELEDSFFYWDSRAPSQLLIREPGLYRIDLTLQWDANIVPDIGYVVLCQNGVETTLRDQKYMRGGPFTPSFSQTLSLSGTVRFAENDLIQAKARFSAPSNIIEQIFSYFDASSRVMSRLDLVYDGP